MFTPLRGSTVLLRTTRSSIPSFPRRTVPSSSPFVQLSHTQTETVNTARDTMIPDLEAVILQ